MRMLTQKVLEIGERVVLQVVASVVATVCVAAITNMYFRDSAPAAVQMERPSFSMDASSVAGLFDATFKEEVFRMPVASPVEFAAVFGPSSETSMSLAGADWAPAAPLQTKQDKAQPKIRTSLAACEDCGRLPPVQVIPPARPAFERPVETMTQAAVLAPEPEAETQLEILGVALPKLLPTGQKIVSTLTSWGGSLTDLVLR